MREKIYWKLVGLADLFADIGFAHSPGVVASACLRIADVLDHLAFTLVHGGAA